jgi:hypothetical protein
MREANDYIQKLGHYIQSFILKNNMEFGQEEYLDVISNLCIIEDVMFKNRLTESDLIKRISKISTERNASIFYYMLAAEKLLPGLCYDNLEFEVKDKVVNWTFNPNAEERFIAFNKRYYDLDVSGLL